MRDNYQTHGPTQAITHLFSSSDGTFRPLTAHTGTINGSAAVHDHEALNGEERGYVVASWKEI